LKKRKLSEDIALTLEEEFARLNKECVELKKIGAIPKKEKFKMCDLKSVAMIIGVPSIKQLTYVEFKKKLFEIRNKNF
jgi:hypothetical protein